MRVTLTDNSGSIERICEMKNAIISDAECIVEQIVDKSEETKSDIQDDTLTLMKKMLDNNELVEAIVLYNDGATCVSEFFADDLNPYNDIFESLKNTECEEVDTKYLPNVVTSIAPAIVRVIYRNQSTMQSKFHTLMRTGFIDTSDADLVLVTYNHLKVREKHEEYMAVYHIDHKSRF